MKLNFVFLTLLLSLTAISAPTFKTAKSREVHALGLKRTPKSIEFLKALPKKSVHDLRADVAIPGKVDLSAKVSPPENQGSCGSCWDFALTKGLRSALMLVSKDPGVLAFNYLLNNCGPAAQEMGCNGGDFDAGNNFLKGAGPWLESQDPYTASEGRCKTGLNVAGTALTMEMVGGSQPDFHDLAYAVSQNHMLVIDVAVAGAWESYSSGIYNQNDGSASGINHMINLVGYDCETSQDSLGNCTFDSSGKPSKGDGYLIVMNNWGTSWGEAGYMRTRWGMNAVANTAAYFTEAVPVPPVPPVPPTPVPGPGIPAWIWVIAGCVAMIAGLVIAPIKKK